MAQRGDPGFADGSDFSAVEDAQHAGHHAGKAALDADDAAMRDRRAPVDDMAQARQLQVIDITAATFNQAARAGAAD